MIRNTGINHNVKSSDFHCKVIFADSGPLSKPTPNNATVDLFQTTHVPSIDPQVQPPYQQSRSLYHPFGQYKLDANKKGLMLIIRAMLICMHNIGIQVQQYRRYVVNNPRRSKQFKSKI